jgi:hypothetical protein
MGALAKILTLVTLALQTLPLMEIRPASRIHQRFLTIATVRQSLNEEQMFVPCDALRALPAQERGCLEFPGKQNDGLGSPAATCFRVGLQVAGDGRGRLNLKPPAAKF